MIIKEIQPEHLWEILTLNEQAVPHCNSLSISELENLYGESYISLAAFDSQGSICGFLLAMDENANYQSPNFQYFRKNYDHFVYVDRIVVRIDCQRHGLGKKLYQKVLEKMESGPETLTCEVNLRPSNPESLAFHEKLGFVGVEEQETESGAKRVLLMVKKINGLQE